MAFLGLGIERVPVMMAVREDVLRISEVDLLEGSSILQRFVDVKGIGGRPQRSGTVIAEVRRQATQSVAGRLAIIGVPLLL